MNLNEFIRVLRTRWVTTGVAMAIILLVTVIYTAVQTPIYQASTRLFVSTTFGASATDLYQGNRLAQERVLSYTQLIMGETLADRTINRLNLQMSATSLKASVKAQAKPNTVLIDVSVSDPSPLQARDIANALSDEFVAMVRELETPSQGAQADARVVVEQRAKTPSKPAFPNPVRNIALGTALGLLVGIGLALLKELLDNTFKERTTLEQVSGTGVIGITPFDKSRRTDPVIAFENDNSPSAEAFRKLRTNLQFLSVDDPPRMICVTSSVPNEGKSTTSVNISLALAEAGNEVLLIDGDMRRPSLAKYLDLVGSVGFSTVLSGAAPLDDVLQKTKLNNLTALTAGPTPPNPSELLGSLAAKRLLSELRLRFDYVIIDSAPLLAVTDGAILAAEADGVIVMVRANKTKREQLVHSIQLLKNVGANMLGTVLSMVPTRGGQSYNYYHYAPGYAGVEDSNKTRTGKDSVEKPPSDPSSTDH